MRFHIAIFLLLQLARLKEEMKKGNYALASLSRHKNARKQALQANY